ncbi:MAG TPA: nucleotide sugar dehydrogenase [Candidatus Limnocylindria bacterium]|nr:nucleotide sugar dehydrogenase [Candidatus Limnocylindria bacterium]
MSVIGLGYVGLPTASMLASRGHDVYGVDTNERTLKELAEGRTDIREAELDTLVRAAVASGRLRSGSVPKPADIFIIAVGTPVRSDHAPDLDAVTKATRSVAGVLKKGDLVILESTVPPGTTAGLVREILETSGLRAGKDFLLSHCPERVLPGNLLLELVTNDRIIGGIDEASTDASADLYRTFATGTLLRTDATTAELVKLMENTFRDVNIALANEFALIAERLGVDVWEAIKLAGHHPRVRFMSPGPGVGGHCIPVDPWFVAHAAPDIARLITTAREVNDAMPGHAVDLVRDALETLKGRVVVTLGLTYKADVVDRRESPAEHVVELLRSAGAEVRAHDALVASKPDVYELAKGADAVVLLVDHKEYRALAPSELAKRMRRPVAVDTRGVLDRKAWESSGMRLRVLGQGL